MQIPTTYSHLTAAHECCVLFLLYTWLYGNVCCVPSGVTGANALLLFDLGLH